MPRNGTATGFRAGATVNQTLDEMVDGTGRVRPHWRALLSSISAMPVDILADRALRLDRALEDDSVTSLLPSEERTAAAWRCDPFPLLLTSREFTELEAGLAQRARLLDAVLRDLYGRQLLLAEGLLPPQLVFTNPGFLRPCRSATKTPDGALILSCAADLHRGVDGTWRVAADATARMSGLAQAIENRRLLARTIPELFRGVTVRPLRPFLENWQDALRRSAPLDCGDNTVALLTLGVSDPSWAENVVLARALGCTPVEAGDLTVRDGDLFLKTLRGPQRVSVLLRRTEGRHLDPLEFGASASHGVAGLLDAARNGAVRITNEPGAGVVEAPGLAAFLPVLCRRLLGEELLLASSRTLWLGDADARAEMRAAPDQWVLRAAADPQFPAVPLTEAVPRVLAQLEAEPANWVVTATEAPSVAPCWWPENSRKAPRPIALRAFLMHDGARWRVLPGGFARVLEQDGPPLGRMPPGGLSKDVWVLDEEREELAGLPPVPTAALAVRGSGADLPSRVADNLFWLGRYVERLDNAARLARAALIRLERDALLPHEMAELAALARCLVPARLATPDDAPAGGNVEPLRRALVAAARPGGALPILFHRIARLVDATRDRQTSDMHDAFLHPLREMREALPQVNDAQSLSRVLGAALRYSAGVAGVAAENMVRGGAHTFLDLGRRLERAQAVSSALALALDQPPARLEAGLRLSLELCDSVITYRTRYLAAPQPGPVLHLVLADFGNPRGLGFQFERVRLLLREVAGGPDQLTDQTAALLDEATAIASGDPSGAASRLHALEKRSEGLAESISRRYFTLLPPLRTLGPEPPEKKPDPSANVLAGAA